MIRSSWRALCVCLTGLFASGASQAAIKNNYVAPEARAIEGGRSVYVMVPQAEIQPNINISNLTAAAGGGLLFALIDAGVNNARAKEAEKQVIPLREALVGFEVDPRIQAASAATLGGLGWLDVRATKFSKDPSGDAMLAALDAGATPQLLVLRYDYETSADFSAIVVSLHASLVNKATPKGKKPTVRQQAKYLPYTHTFRSFVLLPDPNPKDATANVQAWAADGAKAARTAIELGIQRCGEQLVRSLGYTAAEAASLTKRNKRKMAAVPGVTGWEIESQPTYSVYYEPMAVSLTQVETYGTAQPAAMAVAPAAAATTVTAPEAGAPAAPAAPATPAAPAQ